MADITNLSVQRELKPKVEDVIPHFLDGHNKALALDFVAYLRANKTAPGWAGIHNQWKSVCKGKNICRISFISPRWFATTKSNKRDSKWVVTVYLQHLSTYEDVVIAEGLQHLLWENVYYCVHKPKDSVPHVDLRQSAMSYPCNHWNCAPGKNIIICGKELTNVCRGDNLQYYWVYDPDEMALNGIKRLFELEKQARKTGRK